MQQPLKQAASPAITKEDAFIQLAEAYISDLYQLFCTDSQPNLKSILSIVSSHVAKMSLSSIDVEIHSQRILRTPLADNRRTNYRKNTRKNIRIVYLKNLRDEIRSLGEAPEDDFHCCSALEFATKVSPRKLRENVITAIFIALKRFSLHHKNVNPEILKKIPEVMLDFWVELRSHPEKEFRSLIQHFKSRFPNDDLQTRCLKIAEGLLLLRETVDPLTFYYSIYLPVKTKQANLRTTYERSYRDLQQREHNEQNEHELNDFRFNAKQDLVNQSHRIFSFTEPGTFHMYNPRLGFIFKAYSANEQNTLWHTINLFFSKIENKVDDENSTFVKRVGAELAHLLILKNKSTEILRNAMTQVNDVDLKNSLHNLICKINHAKNYEKVTKLIDNWCQDDLSSPSAPQPSRVTWFSFTSQAQILQDKQNKQVLQDVIQQLKSLINKDANISDSAMISTSTTTVATHSHY